MGKRKKEPLPKAVKRDQAKLTGPADRRIIRKIRDLKPWKDPESDKK